MTQLRERQICFAGDHIVCHPADFLMIRLVAHLRSAEDDSDVRPHALQFADQLQRSDRVPDVDANADDPGFLREDAFQHVDRPLLEIKL